MNKHDLSHERQQQRLPELHQMVYDIIAKKKQDGCNFTEIEQIMSKMSVGRIKLTTVLRDLENFQKIHKESYGQQTFFYSVTYVQKRAKYKDFPWYSQDTIQTELLNKLLNQVFSIVQASNHPVDAMYIERHLNQKNVFDKPLTRDAVLSLINALVYDGRLFQLRDENNSVVYQVAQTQFRRLDQVAMRLNVPCVGCELIHLCKIDGGISPGTCQYIKQWLRDE